MLLTFLLKLLLYHLPVMLSCVSILLVSILLLYFPFNFFFDQLVVQECVVNCMYCEFSVFLLLFISNCIPFWSKESVNFNLFKFAKICFVTYPMIHPEVYSVYTCETFVFGLWWRNCSVLVC